MSQTKSKPLLNRRIKGYSTRALPILPESPDTPKQVINDAYTVLRIMVSHAAHFQISRARIKFETGLSVRRLDAAMQYLQKVNIAGKAVAYGNAQAQGVIYRIDLSGNVQHGGSVLHYGCSSMNRTKKGPSRSQMRRGFAALEDLGISEKDVDQLPTVPSPTEADPLHSYNVQPSEKEKERALLSPAGEIQTSFPETPKAEPQGVMEEAQEPTPQESTITPVELVAEDDEEYEDDDTPMTPEQLTKSGKINPTWMRWQAADYPQEYPNVIPAHTLLGVDDNVECTGGDYLSREAVKALQQQRRAPRMHDAAKWLHCTLMGTMLEQSIPVGDTITPAQAAVICQKLRTGVLTIGHISRYWTMVQSGRVKPQRMEDLLCSMEYSMTVKDVHGVDNLETAWMALVRRYGRELCVGGRDRTWMRVAGDGDRFSKDWEPHGLLVRLRSEDPNIPPPNGYDATLWAARIMALQSLIGAEHLPVATAWLKASGITKAHVEKWFLETEEGRDHYMSMIWAMTSRLSALQSLDPHKCYGLSLVEHQSKLWLQAQLLQLATDDLYAQRGTGRGKVLSEHL